MLLSLLPLALANPDGKVGAAVSGCTCHGNASGGVDVALSADATQVDPGAIVNLTVAVSGGHPAVAGLDVAANGGVFTAGEGTRVERNEVTHAGPATPAEGVGTFTFSWSAEGDGTFRLYGAGLVGNGDGEEVGDAWNFADDVTIVVGTGINPEDSGGDTGGDTGGEPPDCSCAHGTGAGTPALLLPLLVPLLAVRRRRSER